MVIKKELAIIVGILFLILPMISAGVGISWNQESSLIPEQTKTCLTYKIYNPWEQDSYVKIVLSEELEKIVTSQESEMKLIPAQTSSSEAMPVNFCFKTPVIYEKDCWIGKSLICKQSCEQEMKVFEGEVEVKEIDESEINGGGSGGSKTAISVSAPLRVKVQCVKHNRNYSLIYLLVALIAAVLLTINIFRKKKSKKKK